MPKCFKFLLTFSIWETSKWILIAACFLIFTLPVEFAKMGWRNIDSTERVDQGREGRYSVLLGRVKVSMTRFSFLRDIKHQFYYS